MNFPSHPRDMPSDSQSVIFCKRFLWRHSNARANEGEVVAHHLYSDANYQMTFGGEVERQLSAAGC